MFGLFSLYQRIVLVIAHGHMKKVFTIIVFFSLFSKLVSAISIPNLKIEYSYGLDMYCPQKVEPEVLTPLQSW